MLFEAPHRIEALAAALGEACPERRLTVCRELTKQFETVATLSASGLAAWLAADPNRARGEFAVVLHALADKDATAGEADHDALLAPLLAALPLKQAVALAAEIGGAPRNLLYARALVLKAEAAPERTTERAARSGLDGTRQTARRASGDDVALLRLQRCDAVRMPAVPTAAFFNDVCEPDDRQRKGL